MTTIPSADAKAVVAAVRDLSTQVRRIADALTTPVVRETCGATKRGVSGGTPLGPCLQRPQHSGWHQDERGARWWTPECVPTTPDDASTTADDGPRCVCGDPIERWTGPGEPGWIHSPGSDTPCTDARPTPAVRPPHVQDHSAVEHCPACTWDQQHAPAADDDAQRTTRRDSLLNLLARLQRGGMTAEEKVALRQHVETEMREADTARSVARSNLRHVKLLVPELEQAHGAIERVRALAERWDRDAPPPGNRPLTDLRAALDGTEQPTTEGN